MTNIYLYYLFHSHHQSTTTNHQNHLTNISITINEVLTQISSEFLSQDVNNENYDDEQINYKGNC